jgi:hypothetical protein
MNKLINYFLIIGIFSLLLFGCKKGENYNNSSNNKDNANCKIKTTSTPLNPYDSIGILHNQYLAIVLQNVTYVPNSVQDIKTMLQPILNRVCGCTVDLTNYPNNSDFNVNTWIDQMPISTLLKQKVKETIALGNQNLNVADFTSEINNLEATAPQFFSGNELRLYYEHLSVAKYSYKFWSPVSEGGINGSNYINYSSNIDGPVNWKHVFVYDCVGGLFGGGAGYLGTSAVKILDDWIS